MEGRRRLGERPVDIAKGHVIGAPRHGPPRGAPVADGMTARERLVALDDVARRIAYSVIGDTMRPEHDNAVMQIIAEGPGRCRFVWSRDLLPDELAQPLHAGMEAAAAIIK